MDQQVNRLVDKAWKLYEALPASQRLLIGVAGIPGSGKTTLAAAVTNALNQRHAAKSPALGGGTHHPIAIFVPMDGYHLTRAQLSALPNPTTAHARRGAAFTFDAAGFLKLVRMLREPMTPEASTVYAPSFDHQVKDPVDDDIPIKPEAKVIVFEGNYIALDEAEWREARGLMDEVWFVEVGEDTARRRLVDRHVKAGIAKDPTEALKRVEENDLLNGREIMKKRLKVDEVVQSVEDEAWKPENQGLMRKDATPADGQGFAAPAGGTTRVHVGY